MAQKYGSPAPCGGDRASQAVPAGNLNQWRHNTAGWWPPQSSNTLSARELTLALGGQWHGSYGTARCPAHDDHEPSLGIVDGEDRAWVTCHAGCEWPAIRAALADRGLWPDGVGTPMPRIPILPHHQPKARLDRNGDAARRIWNETRPAKGTLVEEYLRGRGIDVPLPPSIRFHSRLHLDGQKVPALVAAVERVGVAGIVAIHRTFLHRPTDGVSPVRMAKKMLGLVAGGTVRLAPAVAHMGIAEGIETALSVMMATGLPVWACLSTSGLRGVVLPPLPLASTVTILADNDASGAGMKAALATKARLVAEGRYVRIALPPVIGTDFNDLLRG